MGDLRSHVQVSVALWSLAELRLQHGALAAALTTAARRHLEVMHAEQAAHVLASMASLCMRDPWLVQALATLLLNRMHQGEALRPGLAVSALCALASVRLPAPLSHTAAQPAPRLPCHARSRLC